MNPKHIETYIEGLHKTVDSKLFFLNKLPDNFFSDPNDPKVVIDLGCGDGTVLKAIRDREGKYNPITNLVAIDTNPDILEYAKKNLGTDALYFNSLTEFIQFVEKEEWIKQKKFVLICESVLHEVGSFQFDIMKFALEYCSYFIVRDMYVRDKDFDDEKTKRICYANIIRYSNTTMLADFIEHYGLNELSLIHYLLKYTYVENWKTEVEEDYTSVIWFLIDTIESECKTIIYDNKYLQAWRHNRVLEDFHIDMNDFCSSTHRELILKLK